MVRRLGAVPARWIALGYPESAWAWGYRQCFMVKKCLKKHGIWDFTINYSNHKWDLLGLKADFRFDMDLTMIYRGFIGF